MLFRTSSHMWGRWYLPMFLFRDGLLTFMYITFFNQPHEVVILPPHYNGEGVLRCSLYLSPKVLADSLIYFLITFQVSTLVPVYDVTLFSDGILVFWSYQEVFDCFASSKVNLYAMFLTYVFETFNEAFCVCYCYDSNYIFSFTEHAGWRKTSFHALWALHWVWEQP